MKTQDPKVRQIAQFFWDFTTQPIVTQVQVSKTGKGEYFGRNCRQAIISHIELAKRGQVIKETIGQTTESILSQVELCQTSQTR